MKKLLTTIMQSMENKRDRDIKFLINGFSLTLIIIAIIITFQPYLEGETRLAEVKQLEGQIVTLEPRDLSLMLASKTDKPVMLVSYASWCYFCRQVMPVVMEMIKNHELDDVTPVFVSLDTEPRKLSRYLVHNDYNPVIFPYVLSHGFSGSIASAVNASGSSFSGVIPYIGFFDKNGKIRAESTGVVSEAQLLEMHKKSSYTP